VARGAQLADQLADAREGALQRVEAGQLAADMDGDALDLEAGQRRGARISVDRLAESDSELVLGGAGRDLRMAAGRDVRIDPESDRRGPTHRGRDGGKHFRLGDGFQVELEDAAFERERISSSVLPTPEKTILSGPRRRRARADTRRPRRRRRRGRPAPAWR
jgi:hypothetical protein